MYGQNGYLPYSYMGTTGYGSTNYTQRNYMQPQQPMIQNQQPMQQFQQQPMQYQPPIQTVQFTTDKEAEAFIVMPNTSALLIDKNSSIAHWKTADGMGQSVAKHYKFYEVDENGEPIKKEEVVSSIDLSNLVSKDELKRFVPIDRYNEFVQSYMNLSKDFEALKKQLFNATNNGNAKAVNQKTVSEQTEK